MSEQKRGSDKLRACCESLATLTPEEIHRVAGGGVSVQTTFAVSAANLRIPDWLIRGTPVDPGILQQATFGKG